MVDLIGEILKRIKQAEKDTSNALAYGANINSFDDYQRMLGNREGLVHALEIIENLLTEDNNEDL